MDVDNARGKVELQTRIICRFCLRIVDKALHLRDTVVSSKDNAKINLFSAVADVVPEIFEQVHPNTLICYQCTDRLRSAFIFRNLCVKTELEMNDFAIRRGVSAATVKLSDVLIEKMKKRKEQYEINEMKNKRRDESSGNEKVDTDVIKEIIERLPEIEDVEDVPDFIDLDKLAAQSSPPNYPETPEILEEMNSESRTKSPPKVIPVQPYILKEILLYPCKFCSRALKSMHNLEQHMGAHMVPKTDCIQCSECRLHIPSLLEHLHMNLHANSLVCPSCQMKVDAPNYVSHMKAHFPENYDSNPSMKMCGICYHQFPMSFFKHHLEFHKLGVPVVSSNNLKCQVCSDIFEYKQLEDHMKLHR